MGGTVFVDPAGLAAAGATLRAQVGALTAEGACRSVAIAGEDRSLARAVADPGRAEQRVATATAAELRRIVRLLDELHDDALAADP